MQIQFPLEFFVVGTPVSLQAKNTNSKEQWKARVLEACREVVDGACFACDDEVTITIYYFCSEDVDGDLDNCVKLILDALVPHILLDDQRVESLIVRRFRPNRLIAFSNPSAALSDAMDGDPPRVYIRIEDEAHGGL